MGQRSETMKRSLKLIMLTTSALTGYFVLTGTSGVKVLPDTSSAVEELLSNGSFETPAIEVGSQVPMRPVGWTMFTSGTSELIALSAGAAHSGNQTARFVAHAIPNFYQGLVQALPVTPGETYHFSAYVKNDPSRPLKGSVIGQLSIEWHGGTSKEISRLWSKAWSASLALTDWTKFEVVGEASPNSAQAHFVIVEKGGGQPMAGSAFFVDDATVVRVSEP